MFGRRKGCQLLAAALIVGCCNTVAFAQDKIACAALPGISFDGAAVKITSSEDVAADTVAAPGIAAKMPAHCLVRGKVAERISAVDGKTYAIGFEMRLPVNWNGRFFFQVNGGNDGSVVPAFGGIGGGGPISNGLLRGFAVVSSDAGHTAEPETAGLVRGALFGFDPQARRDYGYAAIGVLTPLAKNLIGLHYGRPPERSYMLGCSNGGRHAMVTASRYGDQFDGIVAGNPGFNLPKAAIQHAWDIQAFTAVNPDIKQSFSKADMSLVAVKVLEACDGLDGTMDGIIGNPKACKAAFNIQSLACAPGQNSACLTGAQVNALDKVFSGPRNAAGQQLYSDWPYDAGVGSNAAGFGTWRAWKLEGPIAGLPIIGALGSSSLAMIFTTPPTKVAGAPSALLDYLRAFNFETDAQKILATDATYTESAMAFMTPPNPTDLAKFKGRGGKLIVYHGNSDGVFSVNDTIAWYEGLRAANNGDAASFARLFTVPGMTHCGGGPATDQFDMLSAIVDWVEKGAAPEQITAKARGEANSDVPAAWSPTRTRPLCPYPKEPRYRGSGSIEDAQNFECRAPQ